MKNLVNRIQEVMKEHDFFEYRDMYETDQEAFFDILMAIENTPAAVIEMLTGIQEETEDAEITDLINQVRAI